MFPVFQGAAVGTGVLDKQVFLYFTFYLSCQETLGQIAVRQSEYSISISYLTNPKLKLFSLYNVS